MALTPRKRAFVDARRKGASNRDAAIAAGYSEKTASAAGSRLAKDKDVMGELHKLAALRMLPPDVNKMLKPGVNAQGDQEPAQDGGQDADQGQPAPPEPAGFDLAKVLMHNDPKQFLLAVMNDQGQEPKLRVDAAKALMPFVHQRKGEGGKKDQAQAKAAEVAKGKFGTRGPPLKAVK